MRPEGVLIEAESDWLYHGTPCQHLEQIAKAGKLIPWGRPGRQFVSFTAKLEIADLDRFGGAGATLVFRKRAMGDRLMDVEYSRAWAKKHPKHARYIAAMGAMMPWDVWLFLDMKNEDEWIAKRGGPISFSAGELVAVLVDTNRCDIREVREWFAPYVSPHYVVDKRKGMQKIHQRAPLAPDAPLTTRDQVRTAVPAFAQHRKLRLSASVARGMPRGTLIETLVEGRVVVKRSGQEIRLELTGQDAWDAAVKVFPDLAGDTYLVDEMRANKKAAAMLLVRGYREDGDAWWASVFYEQRREEAGGISVSWSRDGWQSDAPFKATVQARSNFRRDEEHKLKPEEHVYPGSRKVDIKAFVARAVREYVTGVMKGTHGQGRTFAARPKREVKRGMPAQLKAIAKIHELVDDERYDVEEMDEREGSTDTTAIYISIRGKRWYDKGGLVRVTARGAVSLLHGATGNSKWETGRSVWSSIEMHYGIMKPSTEADFAALMQILRSESKRVGTDSPEKEAMRKKVEAQFAAAGYAEQSKIINQIWSGLSKAGRAPKRDKRKRIIV